MKDEVLREVGPASSRWLELFRSRELLWTFAAREVKVRYKQAVLGASWALLQPLSLMVVFTVFFSMFLKVPSDGIPYPLFAYSGLLPWSFFATSLAFAVPSLTNNAHLVTKVYFPREVLPLASILAAGLDFAVAALVYVGMLLFYRVPLTPNCLFVPVLLVIQVAFTIGVGLFFAALNVIYRDVRHALPLLIQLWMFLTPVIYPVSVVPERIRVLYLLNPMGGIIDGYRRAVVQGTAPDPVSLSLAALVSAALVWAASRYFRRAERTFADLI